MLKAALIGFHRHKKKHTGVNLAKTIEYLLDQAGVTLSVCPPYDELFICLTLL